jgi:hypothetical protein
MDVACPGYRIKDIAVTVGLFETLGFLLCRRWGRIGYVLTATLLIGGSSASLASAYRPVASTGRFKVLEFGQQIFSNTSGTVKNSNRNTVEKSIPNNVTYQLSRLL